MHGLIEDDVHNPFGGAAVPLLGDAACASVAIENRIRFLHDPLRFVPISQVIGRSVLGRMVRQGTPSTVVSSWIPPLSVRTIRECATKPRKGR